MPNHRPTAQIPWRLMYAYMLIICMTYIYNHHLVSIYGDFISDIGEYDILGDHKCAIEYSKCSSQVLNGWSITRFLIFTLIGFFNPHAHVNMFLLSTFVETYTYSNKCESKFILNPILNMSGYTLGSALCQGGCVH